MWRNRGEFLVLWMKSRMFHLENNQRCKNEKNAFRLFSFALASNDYILWMRDKDRTCVSNDSFVGRKGAFSR